MPCLLQQDLLSHAQVIALFTYTYGGAAVRHLVAAYYNNTPNPTSKSSATKNGDDDAL